MTKYFIALPTQLGLFHEEVEAAGYFWNGDYPHATAVFSDEEGNIVFEIAASSVVYIKRV